MPDAVFTVSGLSFAYDGSHQIFQDFDLSLPEGKITTLIGANGCGKSTLFNLLTKNLVPQAGDVFLRDRRVADLRLREFAQNVAIVHQNNIAPGDITVEKLVEYGRFPFRKRGMGGMTEQDAQMVEWAISTCGLQAVANKPAAALSGGQRQRVWIAMALAQGCDVLLLDEPTTYLDVRYQLDILNLVRRLNRDLGMTVVMVLHDINQALCYSDEIVALANGRVVAQGQPAEVVDQALLRAVYGVDLEIVRVEGRPFVLAADGEEPALSFSQAAGLNPAEWIACAAEQDADATRLTRPVLQPSREDEAIASAQAPAAPFGAAVSSSVEAPAPVGRIPVADKGIHVSAGDAAPFFMPAATSAAAAKRAQLAALKGAAPAVAATGQAQSASFADGPSFRQRPKVVRALWAIAGFISFGLAVVGVVLPVLPTTPLVLLAAFCFARSSDRLNNWFKSTKLYKKVLEGYVTKRAMTVKAKLSIIVPVTLVMGLAFAFMGNVLVVGGVPVARVILAVVWAAHLVYFGAVVKTDEGDQPAASGAAPSASAGVQAKSADKAGAGQSAGKGKDKPMIKTRLLELLSDSKAFIWFQVGWKWLSLLAQILIALSAARLIQMAYDDAWIMWDVGWCIVFVLAGVIIRVWCDRREQANAYLASVDVKRVLRGKIYDKLLRLGASYRESVATSKVVQLAVEGVEQLETYFSLFIPQLFYAVLAPVTLFLVVGFLVSWPTAIILLVFVPLIPASIMAVQTIAKKLLSKYWGSYAALGNTFLENLQGLTTLKIYQSDDYATDVMDEDSEDFRVATMNVLKMQLNSTTIMDIGAYGGAAAGMIMALWQFYNGNVDVGGMVIVMLLAAEFFLPMRRLGSYFHVGMNGMAASDNIFELLDLPERDGGAGLSLPDGPMSFRLSDVGFSYDGERTVLDGVNMEFPTGSFTSIVGTSGCGKSTIANLLMGRNRGYVGSVSADGIEIADISEASLMKHVTLVSNASYLFKGTVRENLMIGNPNSAESELVAVVRQVKLADFLDAQDGLDTQIAEGGSNLSGGQRQRLALARALLHDTPAYIFDEATSAIDVESEEFIMGVVRELAKTRTVILISHRLANVVPSDNIYMMEGGRVAQQGTHDELMAAGGPYAMLFSRQMELEGYTQRAAEERARRQASLTGKEAAR